MKGLAVSSSVLLLLATPAVSRGDTLVPPGTLITCTVSEPNFSSKTAEVGDPVLCYASPVSTLGRSVLPYGTYLIGRFEDYRDPGHFVGKGWMQLTFDRMVSGPDRIIPMSAKVVHVPNMRVDAKGRIVGSGHATRDTVEWMIPVLWPIKVITLPMRGPRPTLKQETRMTLKVMDTILIPGDTSARSALVPRAAYQPASGPLRQFSPVIQTARPVGWTPNPVSTPPAPNAPAPANDLAMLILKNGSVNLASDYWLDGSARVRFVSADGTPGEIPIENLDLAMTVATNQRRGFAFTLRSGNSPRLQ